jgi:hypothetical protein
MLRPQHTRQNDRLLLNQIKPMSIKLGSSNGSNTDESKKNKSSHPTMLWTTEYQWSLT